MDMGLILTGQTPPWLDLVGEETSLSYISLATDERWRDYFYTYDCERLAGYCKGLLGCAMPIRPEVISAYTKRYTGGTVAIERRFPHETYDETLPNIVELAMWWIARTKDSGGNHGLSTNHKTRSKETF